MTRCPDCDSPMEYDGDSGKYYCPRCEKHLESIEAKQEKTIYQDSTDNPDPDTTTYWDEDESAHGEEETDG